MILSGQTIRRLSAGPAPLISPFAERTIAGGMTYGVGPAGFDVRAEFDREGAIPFVALAPGEFLLASTIERFDLPTNVLGRVCDKSSWARRGLSVFNTIIEPGWAGWLTLELKNNGREELLIGRGVPIAQIVFEFLDEAAERPYADGKYQHQGRGPQGPR